MDLDRAATFVREHGSEVERARLERVLTGKAPPGWIATKLFAGQRRNGGWAPPWAADYSSLDATCYRLAGAEALGFLRSDPVAHAAQFLLFRQRGDGSWEEDESVRDEAPPRVRPGNESARLYLTANCSYWLALLMSGVPAAARSARYLADHLGDADRLSSFLHTQWLAAGAWYRLGERAVAERVMESLRQEVPRLTASHLAWLLTSLSAAGVPQDHPLMRTARQRLAGEQQPAGHWISEDGPQRNVHVTLEAMRALSAGDSLPSTPHAEHIQQ